MLSWYQLITTLVTFLHMLEKIWLAWPGLLSTDKINLHSISLHGHKAFILNFHLNVVLLAFMFCGIIFVFWFQNIVTLIIFFLFDLSLLIIHIVECGCGRRRGFGGGLGLGLGLGLTLGLGLGCVYTSSEDTSAHLGSVLGHVLGTFVNLPRHCSSSVQKWSGLTSRNMSSWNISSIYHHYPDLSIHEQIINQEGWYSNEFLPTGWSIWVKPSLGQPSRYSLCLFFGNLFCLYPS